MRIIDRIKGAPADPASPLDEEIEQYHQQRRELVRRSLNGQRVYDDLSRAVRALADEVAKPQKA
ncbi:MAG: hypothetical protein RIB84_23950 [Sneathiellaceae bacterium]